MKKFVLAAAAILVTATSFSAPAFADGRGNDEWRRNGHRDNSGFRADRRHGEWRRDGWRHDGWRRHVWRPGYRPGPRVVIRPGYVAPYCFIKKVRRYDDWGNLYVKRVRVCR